MWVGRPAWRTTVPRSTTRSMKAPYRPSVSVRLGRSVRGDHRENRPPQIAVQQRTPDCFPQRGVRREVAHSAGDLPACGPVFMRTCVRVHNADSGLGRLAAGRGRGGRLWRLWLAGLRSRVHANLRSCTQSRMQDCCRGGFAPISGTRERGRRVGGHVRVSSNLRSFCHRGSPGSAPVGWVGFDGRGGPSYPTGG